MKKILNSSVTLIFMSLIVVLVVSFAVKQFFLLREVVYQDAFYNLE